VSAAAARIWRRARPSSRIAMTVAAALAIGGLALIGRGAAIYAKAILAQYLLEDAFDRSLASGEPVKAWPWADSWPVAKLEVPRLIASAIVLKGGSGEALAFGPGHLDSTPLPGNEGASVISAHRDTHFRFLRDIRLGDEIKVTRTDGAIYWFRVTSMDVVRWDASGIDPDREGYWLALATCWPFEAATPGDLRFVARAELAGRQITAGNARAEPKARRN
jgi:sortase A